MLAAQCWQWCGVEQQGVEGHMGLHQERWGAHGARHGGWGDAQGPEAEQWHCGAVGGGALSPPPPIHDRQFASMS